MKEIALTAVKRPSVGKGPARQSRRDGYIPGVVYGPEVEPTSVAVDERTFRQTMRQSSGASIINLDVDGKQNKVVLRELQRDPVTSRIIHVDFHAISMNKPINVAVPINLTGTPEGVKTDGGIMQQTMRELRIECLPKDIPDEITIDVEELRIGDSIHVRDLDVPNVRVLSEEQRTIVTIAAPTVIKVDEPAEAEAEEGVEGEAAEGEAPAEGAPAEGEAGEAKKDEGKKEEGKKKEK